MSPQTSAALAQLMSNEKDLQNSAFTYFMETTSQPVDWAYEVWDQMVAALRDQDNRVRAIAAQVLCNLAKSDPEQRMSAALPHLINLTRDERFVTARHCLQSLWKVGVVSAALRAQLMQSLAGRFHECVAEKNCTLIRFDIIEAVARIFDQVKDETLREQAQAWIASEADLKYRKKYAAVWRNR